MLESSGIEVRQYGNPGNSLPWSWSAPEIPRKFAFFFTVKSLTLLICAVMSRIFRHMREDLGRMVLFHPRTKVLQRFIWILENIYILNMKVKMLALSPVPLFVTSWTVSARLLCPWNSPSDNTGLSSHFLIQESSQPRDPTQVSCTAGRFFAIWATREDHTVNV